jgi:vacuolar-type H+-ATPase subunit C/Vma6
MQESGYESGEPEDALTKEVQAVYVLACEVMPESRYVETLLLFHDAHNLKTILKHFAVGWVRTENIAGQPDLAETENRPGSFVNVSAAGELPRSDSYLDMKQIEMLMLKPSLTGPETLFAAIRDRQPENIPGWLYCLAMNAVERYCQTYDISSIDRVIDRASYQKAAEEAEVLGNRWFIDYFKLRRDLINLESLLRCRALGVGHTYFMQCLLPGGNLDENMWTKFYDTDSGQWIIELERTSLSDFSGIAKQYGQPGSATRFGRLADQKILEHLRKALRVLNGPEIPLAYLLARELEIKNIRFALTCLRNNIPSARAKDMARESYLNWRV